MKDAGDIKITATNADSIADGIVVWQGPEQGICVRINMNLARRQFGFQAQFGGKLRFRQRPIFRLGAGKLRDTLADTRKIIADSKILAVFSTGAWAFQRRKI